MKPNPKSGSVVYAFGKPGNPSEDTKNELTAEQKAYWDRAIDQVVREEKKGNSSVLPEASP